MSTPTDRGIARSLPLVAALVVCVAMGHGTALGENTDPDADGSQYAWTENVGWINTQPLGPGGPGMQVDDFTLTGWAWGENIGWISLSCENTSTCATVEYRVRNDGNGVLSGYGWAENVGWIDFAPATSGVTIDVSTGEFAGSAWAENTGWIFFASSGANPFVVKTGWRCDPAPAPPAAVLDLMAAKSGIDIDLTWGAVGGATGYDLVQGDLTVLRGNTGDYGLATEGCVLNKGAQTSAVFTGDPAPGEGYWFLVRGANCGGGTFDTGGPSQSGPRDPGVAASGNGCD